MSTLFEFLPIGAYRSNESGVMLRANAALVQLNGYGSEAELLLGVTDIANEWYVVPSRRDEFKALMARDGRVVDFVSEIYRHKSRARCWVRENAHLVRSPSGEVLYYEGTIEDISASHRALQGLKDSELMLREITSEVPGMLYRIVFESGKPGRYTFVSSGVRALCGLEPEAVLADSSALRNLRHPQDRERVETQIGKALRERAPLHLEYRIILPNGTQKWVQMASSQSVTTGDDLVRSGVVLDITERKLAEIALQETEARWKLALESAGDGVWDWYIQSGKEFFSQRCKEIYGFSADEIADESQELDGRTHPEDVPKMLQDREDHFNGRTPTYSNEHRIQCKDGSWKWVLTRGMVISRDAQGNPLRMIGTHTDITDRKSAEELVWRQAHYDPLTALPNRRMLRESLLAAIAESQRTGAALAVLFIDLDHFKEVNDTLGHDSGDMLLIDAAQRIAQCLGPQDTVARMGGDEFTVVLTTPPARGQIEGLLQRILDRLAAAFALQGEQVFVSASMGIAFYPRDASNVEDLFKHADQALYEAKGAGRNRYRFFTPELQEAALTRLRLAADLRTALANHEFEVVYQPIVDLASGLVRKAEALLRWHHPQRGLVSPAQFIGIAESTGLILDIGEWVFRQAALQAKACRDSIHPDFQISVNKSPVQFQTAPQVSWSATLEAMGLPGNSIAVEITEGLLLDATGTVLTELQDLRNAGIAVSLDDFGTGYSSLTYLQRFATDFVKIDQSFVRNLHAGSTDLALCKAIVTMAHELHMKVIAEGVETAEQCGLLVGAGCDFGQGYLFAIPMGADAFMAFCITHNAEAAA